MALEAAQVRLEDAIALMEAKPEPSAEPLEFNCNVCEDVGLVSQRRFDSGVELPPDTISCFKCAPQDKWELVRDENAIIAADWQFLLLEEATDPREEAAGWDVDGDIGLWTPITNLPQSFVVGGCVSDFCGGCGIEAGWFRRPKV